jgi:hypothetical protein
MNYLFKLASNLDPPDLCLLSSWDYRHEAWGTSTQQKAVFLIDNFLKLDGATLGHFSLVYNSSFVVWKVLWTWLGSDPRCECFGGGEAQS